jgi:hypothetical protein
MTDAQRIDFLSGIADLGTRAVFEGVTVDDAKALDEKCSFLAKRFAFHRKNSHADAGTAFRLAVDDTASRGKVEPAYVLGR